MTTPEPMTVKLGGTAGAYTASLDALAARARPGWVVVHGGGSDVADWSRRLGIEPATRDGLRVTDSETLDVAVGVLRGLVNARIVASLAAAGVRAVGLSGVDGDLLRAERFDPQLGEVGRITAVTTGLLDTLANEGYVTVVAPIARGPGDALLNVNADEVAGAVAAARGGRLVMLTDVPGVMSDGALAPVISTDEAARMLAAETATGGMRPKLRAATVAAEAGCRVVIADGTDAAATGAALDGEAVGTAVTRGG